MHTNSSIGTCRPGGRRAAIGRGCGTVALAAGLLTGCGIESGPDTASAPASILPAAPAGTGCADGGSVRTTVFGALEGDVDWSGTTMNCEGMPRPGGEGVRLRFAGIAESTSLAIILGVDGLGPEETAVELPTNVTIIEEGHGRFFSTADLDACWTDIERQVAIDAGSGRYAIDGTLYCIAPLVEVNGSGAVSIPELRFSGLVDWDPS